MPHISDIRDFDPEEAPLFETVLTPIHRKGWPLIAAFAAATVLLWWLWTPLGLLGVVLTAWCVYFFRDPDRVTPTRPGLVISPADGVVQMIQPASPPPEINMGGRPLMRISNFMNVFNVHENRIPVDAEVVNLAHRPGKFVNASLDKASEEHDLLIAVTLNPHEPQETMVHVPIGDLGIADDEPYVVHDLLTGERYTWRGVRNYVRLDPAYQPGHVLLVERMTVPEPVRPPRRAL